MVAGHRLANFEEVFLSSSLEIVNQEAAWVPIILRLVKDLELDISRLPSLYSELVLVRGAAFLLRYMLDMRQVLDRDASLGTEHSREPSSPIFLWRNARQFYVVFETDCVLLALSLDLPCFSLRIMSIFFPVFFVFGLIIVELDKIFYV